MIQTFYWCLETLQKESFKGLFAWATRDHQLEEFIVRKQEIQDAQNWFHNWLLSGGRENFWVPWWMVSTLPYGSDLLTPAIVCPREEKRKQW